MTLVSVESTCHYQLTLLEHLHVSRYISIECDSEYVVIIHQPTPLVGDWFPHDLPFHKPSVGVQVILMFRMVTLTLWY